MERKINRSILTAAKTNKNDEFYTLYVDIVRELQHYKPHFRDKVVYCNCDDPCVSNFFKYFVDNFAELGLKKVIASCFKPATPDNPIPQGYWYAYTGVENPTPTLADVTYFTGNGDFRSAEVRDLLAEADLVITNPPFSLFREYIAQLMECSKKFLVIGNINCITYKEIFKLIQDNQVWLGINMGRGISGFIVPPHYELYGTETHVDEFGNRIVASNNCLWLTNLDNFKRHIDLPLTREYRGNEDKYPFYDNYPAINVNKTSDIPQDFDGDMGVPLTFLHKFNPEQFQIVQFRKGNDGKDLAIHGKCRYFRILIRRLA